MKRKSGRSDASDVAAGAAGWGARIVALLFSAVFMLAFGAGGVMGGIVPLALTAWRAVEVTGWQPVSAQVLDVQLDTHRGSKGGSTYAVRARYAYRVGGRDYEGTRVGLLDWGSDNIGDWHHDWQARLADARAREQPVAAWIDPGRPERSVLDRGVRWGMVALHLPFAVLFTGVGVGAAFMFFGVLSGRPGWKPFQKVRSRAAAPRAVPDGAVAAGTRGRLDQGDGVLVFRRWWPRGVAVVMALPALLWLASGGAPAGLAGRLLVAACTTAWLALALHLATLRWSWRRDDQGVRVEHRSWLRTRQFTLTPASMPQVEAVLVFTSSTNGGPTVRHQRLVLRRPGASPLALTPALAGPDALQAVQRHLQQAMAPTRRPR